MQPNKRTGALERGIERFPSLDRVSSGYKILAIISGNLGAVKVLSEIWELGKPENDKIATTAAWIALVMECIGIVAAVITFLALSELVHLVLEASEHWRMTARNDTPVSVPTDPTSRARSSTS